MLGRIKECQTQISVYEEKAKLGDVDSMYNLALLYYDYSDANDKEARFEEWIRKAAENGHGEANYILAKINCEKSKSQLAFLYMKQAALLGVVEAKAALGVMYEHGVGTNESEVTALAHYEEAAKYGHADSMAAIGALYKLGNGVDKDMDKYLYWYDKAASSGNSKAAFHLGFNYLKGGSVQIDIRKAEEYLVSSVNMRNEDALAVMPELMMAKGDILAAYSWCEFASKAIFNPPLICLFPPPEFESIDSNKLQKMTQNISDKYGVGGFRRSLGFAVCGRYASGSG